MNSLVLSPLNAEVSSAGPIKASKRVSARRCLFGRPDHQKVDQWLAEKLAEIREEKRQKWAMRMETHIQPCVSAIAPDYVVHIVSAQKVPKFYHTVHFNGDMHCLSSDVENHSPCTSEDRFSSLNFPVVTPPHTDITPITIKRSRLPTKRQTKLTAFMKVESRKRPRVENKINAEKKNHEAAAFSSNLSPATLISERQSGSL